MAEHVKAAGLLPDRLVAQRYKVTVRTIERWSENPDLGFPPPVYINKRKYRVPSKLDAWDAARLREAIKEASRSSEKRRSKR